MKFFSYLKLPNKDFLNRIDPWKYQFHNYSNSSYCFNRSIVNFINILCATFLPIFWYQKISKPNITREKLLNLLLYEKRKLKMLMKLTPAQLPLVYIAKIQHIKWAYFKLKVLYEVELEYFHEVEAEKTEHFSE
jgi:hypothetical protein